MKLSQNESDYVRFGHASDFVDSLVCVYIRKQKSPSLTKLSILLNHDFSSRLIYRESF